jgi:hypothetical protein
MATRWRRLKNSTRSRAEPTRLKRHTPPRCADGDSDVLEDAVQGACGGAPGAEIASSGDKRDGVPDDADTPDGVGGVAENRAAVPVGGGAPESRVLRGDGCFDDWRIPGGADGPWQVSVCRWPRRWR